MGIPIPMVTLRKRGRRVTRPFGRWAPLYPSRAGRSIAMASWTVVSPRLITVSIMMFISARAISAVVVVPVPSWAPAPAATVGSGTPPSGIVCIFTISSWRFRRRSPRVRTISLCVVIMDG
jgi:hypothetical protein